MLLTGGGGEIIGKLLHGVIFDEYKALTKLNSIKPGKLWQRESNLFQILTSMHKIVKFWLTGSYSEHEQILKMFNV